MSIIDDNSNNFFIVKDDFKRVRKCNAIELPVDISENMIPKYVVYYKECYNKDKMLFREMKKMKMMKMKKMKMRKMMKMRMRMMKMKTRKFSLVNIMTTKKMKGFTMKASVLHLNIVKKNNWRNKKI